MLIMIYHRVHADPDPLFPGEPTEDSFRWKMEVVAKYARPLSLIEGVRRLRDGTLPPRSVAITFDDGYADNATIAAPVLRSVGVPATFFVATGFLDGGRMWNDTVIESIRRAREPTLDLRIIGLGKREAVGDWAGKRLLAKRVLVAIKHRPQEERERLANLLAESTNAGLTDCLMMTGSQVRQLAGSGIEIGAHTVTHPILRVLDDVSAEREIRDSRSTLERLVGGAVSLFAYPNGKRGEDYGQTHVGIVRRLGFEAAVSTNRGVAHAASDPYELPRFTPWDRRPELFLGRLLWEFRNAA
jgi:peptidoglycan/xylan/chitin deacetylase (PgdA/CDA1 family)